MTKKELRKEIIKGIKHLCREENKKDSKFNHTYSCNRWQEHGKDRLYINRSNGRNDKTMGYIDLNNIDFSNLKVPAGKMYSGIKSMKKQIKEMEVN